MAEERTRFEHQWLEEDLQRLAVEVRQLRQNPERKAVSDETLLKEALQGIAKEAGERAGDQSESHGSPLPAYLGEASPETKLEVEYLLDVTFHKGLEKAIAEGRTSTPFVEDAFHAVLIEKFLPELRERGLL